MAKDQRICSDEYFDRYFRYAVPSTDVSDVQVNDLLEMAGTGNLENVKAKLSTMSDNGRMLRLVPKLRQREKTIENPAARTLALAIAEKASLVPRESQMFISDLTLTQAAILLKNLLRETVPGAEREKLAHEIIQQAETLPFAFECFRWFCKNEKETEAERLLSEEAEGELGRLLTNRVQLAAYANPLYKEFRDDAPRLFWLWKEYGSAAEVEMYLRKRFQENIGEVDEFLACFVGKAWRLESGLSHVANFERHSYDAVANVIDPKFILESLVKRHGQLTGDEFHHPSEIPLSRRISNSSLMFIGASQSLTHSKGKHLYIDALHRTLPKSFP